MNHPCVGNITTRGGRTPTGFNFKAMKVIQAFTDKVTKRRYEVGDTYEGPRGAELAEKGFVEAKEKQEQTHVKKDAEIEPTKKRTRKG